MDIILNYDNMNITAKDNLLFTEIIEIVEDLPLEWHVISGTCMFVEGNAEMLYKLLVKLTYMYLGKIEII